MQQPQTSQSKVNVHPQALTFSEDMRYEQLALWLSNHHKLKGKGYQEDISKLKGTYNSDDHSHGIMHILIVSH